MELPQIDPIHPGEILHDFITDTGNSVETVAANASINATQLNQILAGEQDITPEIAAQLGNHFKTTPQFWINLQHQYDKDRKE